MIEKEPEFENKDPETISSKIERIKQLERELMELKGEREKELERRREIAKKFIEKAQEKIKIISWNISGSTAREDFSFSSDLDIDILLEKELEKMDYLYLHDYLPKRELKETGLYIQVHDFTLPQIEEMKNYDPKMYQWYKEYFKIE